jgi:TetR/AcrR family transcriptional regulator, cholesterol catabolism regulator
VKGRAGGRAGRTPENPPRKRYRELIDASMRVFSAQGYDSTSIQDIADEIGILKGSIYYYIDTKEDLLFEILREVHEEAMAQVAEAIAIDGDPLQKLRAAVTTLSTFNAENTVRMGIFFQDFRSLSAKRRKEIVQERDQYDDVLRRLIREGQEAGLMCPDLDPKLTAMAIMGMVNWISQWYKPAGVRRSRQIGTAYADFVLSAVACTPERHVPGRLAELGALVPPEPATA